MKIQTIFLTVSIMATLAISSCSNSATDKDFIGKPTTKFESHLLTPEALWSLGRIGSVQVAPDSKTAVYNVTYYSIEQNKSHSVLYTQSLDEKENKILTTTNDNERNAVFYDGGKKVLFLSNKSGSQQLWSMNADGSGRKQVSDLTDDISEFLLSPDEKQIVLIMEVEDTTNIQKNDEDVRGVKFYSADGEFLEFVPFLRGGSGLDYGRQYEHITINPPHNNREAQLVLVN